MFSWPDGGSVADGRRQVGNGRARNRARARLNWFSQGQRRGRCKVSRPAREKNRRRRVLVVTTCWPRPMRVVQRARLWAMTPYRVRGRLWTANQAPFGMLRIGGKTARGQVVEAHAVLEVANGILDLGVAAMVGLQCQGCPVPFGDAGVMAVSGEEGQLGTGRGLHPPDDEPHRRGVGLTLERGAGRGYRWPPPQRRRRPSSKGWASSPSRVSPR